MGRKVEKCFISKVFESNIHEVFKRLKFGNERLIIKFNGKLTELGTLNYQIFYDQNPLHSLSVTFIEKTRGGAHIEIARSFARDLTITVRNQCTLEEVRKEIIPEIKSRIFGYQMEKLFDTLVVVGIRYKLIRVRKIEHATQTEDMSMGIDRKVTIYHPEYREAVVPVQITGSEGSAERHLKKHQDIRILVLNLENKSTIHTRFEKLLEGFLENSNKRIF